MLDTIKKLQKIWNYGGARTFWNNRKNHPLYPLSVIPLAVPATQAIASVCAHSVSISIGLCQGYSAILVPQLMSSSSITVDAEQASWLASLGAVSNPVGSILSGVFAEVLGRRKSMQISSIPFIIGWIVIATSVDIPWLYAGRFITGIAAGMSTACYTYVTEISTPENRGILQALGPICASLGILLTYCLGFIISWRILAYGSVIFAILTLIGVQLVPESPAWLLKKNKKNETLSSLIWFRRSVNAAQQEYNELLNFRTEKHIDHTPMNAYFSRRTMKPFVILILLFLCQELSGIYTILYYTVIFFKDSSVEIDEYVASIIVGVIRFLMSIVAAFLIKKYGRKQLSFVSATGMAISMLITASYIKYYEMNEVPRVFPTLPLIFVLLNVFFSMVGMLPIPWIMVGELFPLEVRGIMSGLVVCAAQFAVFACVKVHVNIVEYLHFSGALFIFAGASVFTMFYTKYILPETKDKTLAEIERYFSNESSKTGVDNSAFTIASEQTISKTNHNSKVGNTGDDIEVSIGT